MGWVFLHYTVCNMQVGVVVDKKGFPLFSSLREAVHSVPCYLEAFPLRNIPLSGLVASSNRPRFLAPERPDIKKISSSLPSRATGCLLGANASWDESLTFRRVVDLRTWTQRKSPSDIWKDGGGLPHVKRRGCPDESIQPPRSFGP